MSEDQLKSRICGNEFPEKIRVLQIDEALYTRLCADLRELAVMWRDRALVDKRLASELYIIVRTADYAASKLHEFGDVNAPRAADMSTELDALALECFACT